MTFGMLDEDTGRKSPTLIIPGTVSPISVKSAAASVTLRI